MTTLTLYTDASRFLTVAQADLGRSEIANSLLLGIALRLSRDATYSSRPFFLATVQDDHGLAAAAVMTPPYSLVVYAGQPDPNAAFTALADALCEQGWDTPGVNGPAPASAQFAAVWRQRTGQPVRLGMNLRAFELRRVTPPQDVSGALRRATLADLALVEQWWDEFTMEAMPNEAGNRSPDAARQSIEEGRIVLWRDDGQDVSMAAQTRVLLQGVTVSLVYTPPARRGRGYASACVAALSQHLLDSGWQYCTLFTDLANPVSNSIYPRIGYQPVCDYEHYHFEDSR